MKVALFDFCETLANFQTADRFVDYVRNKEQKRSSIIYKSIHTLLTKSRIIVVLSLLFPHSSINKRIYALQLRGLSYDKLSLLAKSYYEEIVRPNLISAVIEELLRLQKESYRIVLVSGGYDLYLKYFAEEYNIESNDIISTSFKFRDGVCSGLFEGHDCLFDEKVKRLDRKMKEWQGTSIAYSDSQSDTPMLEWASSAIVVRNRNKSKWNNKFQELIWEK